MFHLKIQFQAHPAGLLQSGNRVACYPIDNKPFRRDSVSMAKSQHAVRYRFLPALLRKLREDADFTQRQLATKLRSSHVFVHKSEVGERRVDVTEFIDWCIACGVEPEETLRTLRRKRGV